MRRPKTYLISQSTLELILITALVMIAIAVMGPYVVRSVNAYLRSWERQADQGDIDVEIGSLPWITPPEPELNCETLDCGQSALQSKAACTQDGLVSECCKWVEKYKDKPGQACGFDKSACVNRSDLCDNSEFCCGGPTALNPYDNAWCEDKSQCHPWDCSSCYTGECDYKCRDKPAGTDPGSWTGWEDCDCPDCMPQSVNGILNPYSSTVASCACSSNNVEACADCPICSCGDGYCRWTEREGGPGPYCALDCECGVCEGQYFIESYGPVCEIDNNIVCPPGMCPPWPHPWYSFDGSQTDHCAQWNGFQQECLATDGCHWEPEGYYYSCNSFDDDFSGCHQHVPPCSWQFGPCAEEPPEPEDPCPELSYDKPTCCENPECVWQVVVNCYESGCYDCPCTSPQNLTKCVKKPGPGHTPCTSYGEAGCCCYKVVPQECGNQCICLQ